MSDEFSAIVGRHIHQADRDHDVRQELFDAYMGEPRGDEVKGRSQVVTSEVFDTVEALTAEIMDMIASEQSVASFTAMGPDDEDRAENETDACNHIFWEQNNGFEFLQTFVKSGLIEQMGYARSGWVESEDIEIDQFTDLTIEEAAALYQQKAGDDALVDYDIVDAEGFTEDDGEFMLEEGATSVSFKLRCRRVVQEYKVEPIAQSSVLLTPRWHKISLQDVPFCAIEHTEYTRSDMIAMGFHKDDVASLSDDSSDEEEEERHLTKDNDDEGWSAGAYATEPVRVYECWVLVDDDDDGLAERYKVWMDTNGKKILRWKDGTEAKEEVDSVELSAWTPISVPSRHVGRSVAETIDDLQSISTVLMRQTLDAVYTTNYPRPVVDVDAITEHTFADLANVAPGAPVRTRGPNAVAWMKPPGIESATLPLMEKVLAQKEERTGVTRLNQGMDAETLNKTASGQQLLLSQGQKRLKLIARNLAEGVRDIFVRMHRDLRRGNVSKVQFRRNGQWTEENPMTWPVRKGMSVSIGTGNGDRSEKQQTLMMVGNLQRELSANGSMMVDEEKIFGTADRMVKMGGYSGAALFLKDPRTPEFQQAAQQAAQQPPPPDANIILAEAEASKAEAMAGKYEADALLTLEKIKLDGVKATQEHDRKMMELQIKGQELQLAESRIVAGIQNDGEKQDLAEKSQAQDEAFRRDKLVVDTLNV